MLNIYLEYYKSGVLLTIGKYLLIILPIVVPIMLIYTAWIIRFRWVTMKYTDSLKTCLLEIRLPKEILKSPAAMEIFFTHMAQGGAGFYAEAFVDGRTRPWFSFEIVSTGGAVRFFVWISNAGKFRNLVEAQLYAQYPNLEIFEAEDYTKDFYFNDKYSLFALQYGLGKADPYPIKTYIDYGLGQGEDQKEEYKIDPITSVIEYLGSLKQGENAWIQILIQKHEKESWKHGVLLLEDTETDPKKATFWDKVLLSMFGKSKDLKAEVKAEIEKIKKSTIPEGDEKTTLKIPNPTKGQQEVIAALERSATKVAFDCMIRSIYITEKDRFNPANLGGLIGSFKQYNSNSLNNFVPYFTSDTDDAKKDWGRIFPFVKKWQAEDVLRVKKDLLYAYKLRSFFQWPYKNYWKKHQTKKPFVLTTEELATIWHFPGGIASQTPTLQRVSSKKSEAPSNLPI